MEIFLVWDTAGILPLGQGLFFGLSDYALAIHSNLATLVLGKFLIYGMERASGAAVVLDSVQERGLRCNRGSDHPGHLRRGARIAAPYCE